MGLHFMGLHLIGLHVISLHVIGLHVIGLHVIGLHLMGLDIQVAVYVDDLLILEPTKQKFSISRMLSTDVSR